MKPFASSVSTILVDGWRGDSKIALHVGLGRRLSIHLRVVVDESQVLTLLVCVSHFHAIVASPILCRKAHTIMPALDARTNRKRRENQWECRNSSQHWTHRQKPVLKWNVVVGDARAEPRLFSSRGLRSLSGAWHRNRLLGILSRRGFTAASAAE